MAGTFSGYGIGGGALAAFYTVTVGTTQTTLASTTPVFTCEAQISTDGAKDDSGVPTFTLDQIRADSAFFNFVKTYAGTVTGVTPEDLTLEDGAQQLGASANGTTLAAAFKGPKIIGGTDDGKTMFWTGLVKLAQSSGSVNFSAGTYVKPTLVATAQKITADLQFAANVLAKFTTAAGTTSAAVTVAASTEAYGAWQFQA
jgi:hypothetical protein